MCALALPVHSVSAHQPEYIATETAIAIPDPDTSRAYYGELTGVPAVYTLSSAQEFSLYLNILSPYLPDARKDFVVTVTSATGTIVTTLQAPVSEWLQWYEEFAGDEYWKGPEFKRTVPAGTYTISVTNPTNTGKYVLAPGEAEIFTLTGTPSTIQHIYQVKTLFFNKPWYSVFEGIIGKMLLGFVVVSVLLVVTAAFFVNRRLRKQR